MNSVLVPAAASLVWLPNVGSSLAFILPHATGDVIAASKLMYNENRGPINLWGGSYAINDASSVFLFFRCLILLGGMMLSSLGYAWSNNVTFATPAITGIVVKFPAKDGG